jgi:hypothetical protein
MILIFIGQLGRIFGIIIVQILSFAGLPQHRQNLKYLSIWLLSTWIFCLPKAAVQATLGGVPYQLNIIGGADGLNKGKFIQQGCTFSIILLAPIGVLLTNIVGKPLCKALNDIDNTCENHLPSKEHECISPIHTNPSKK